MQKIRIGIIALILITCLTSCASEQAQYSTGKMQPTPPVELQSLPHWIRIECAADQRVNIAGVTLWELPGTAPSDPNSAYQGNRGKQLGVIQGCTEVMVVEYRWSETDRFFWVLVKDVSDLEGWVPLDLLDFSSP